MALLARVIKDVRKWTVLGEGMPGDMEFPVGVIADLYDARGGTSFWSVSGCEGDDVCRMVANWACEPSRSELTAVEIRFVDEDTVRALDITSEAREAGTGPDKEFRRNHRDVHVRTNGDAIRLAKEMVKERLSL